MVLQKRFFTNHKLYNALRVDLLETVRDEISRSPSTYKANVALSWMNKAVAASSSQQADWIVEYFLGLALRTLAGKRHALDLRCEIEFAMLEFDQTQGSKTR